VLGQCPQERGERGVPVLAGVAVDVVHPRGARHERRVRHDLVEPAPRHGLQPRPLQKLDVETVQGERGAGHREGARREVRAGDGARVPGGVQGLHTAAGAQIQQGPDRAARRRSRQGQ
jgi:hypothetical protein